MGYLTKEQILERDDRKYAEVEVWGGKVRLRSMDVATFDALYAKANEDKAFAARVVAASVVDDEGHLVFGESGDVKHLMKKGIVEMRTIVQAVLKLNGATKEQIAAMEKNFESDRNADSDSTSQES